MRHRYGWVSAVVLTASLTMVFATVPLLINYQGRLVDAGGNPVTGNIVVSVGLHDSLTGGEELYAENVGAVAVQNGIYTFRFGADSGTLSTALLNAECWLEVVINGTALVPRQRLVAVPYALQSGTTDHIGSNTTFAAGIITAHALAPGTVTNSALDPSGLSNLFWTVAGNANTAPGTHFLGTTDSSPLEVRVNGQRVWQIAHSGVSPNILGGHSGNTITPSAEGAVISGGGAAGTANTVTTSYGTIGGGQANAVSGRAATIAGGKHNAATGFNAAIGGGSYNRARATDAAVAGGRGNFADGETATVSGGALNKAMSQSATVGGGGSNIASNDYATVGGGAENTAEGTHSTIGGGQLNSVTAAGATVSGGENNAAMMDYATVAGGVDNTADADGATVGGGDNNVASGDAATVAGGLDNQATRDNAVVGGGTDNLANSAGATVGGGSSNRASGSNATVPGGFANRAVGTNSFAAGHRAVAAHDYTFVWADSAGQEFTSTASNQFLVHASGGVGIGTPNPAAALDVLGDIKSSEGLSVGGATSLSNTLTVAGAADLNNTLTVAGAIESTTGGFKFPDSTTNMSANSRWVIAGSDIYSAVAGDVGIGISNPPSKLAVAGAIESTTGGFKYPDGTTNMSANSRWVLSGNDLYSAISGNVGIGKSPESSAKLDVAGTIKSSGNLHAGGFVTVAGSDVRFGAGDGTPVVSANASGDLMLRPTVPGRLVTVRDAASLRSIHLHGGTDNYIQSVGEDGSTPANLAIQPDGGDLDVGGDFDIAGTMRVAGADILFGAGGAGASVMYAEVGNSNLFLRPPVDGGSIVARDENSGKSIHLYGGGRNHIQSYHTNGTSPYALDVQPYGGGLVVGKAEANSDLTVHGSVESTTTGFIFPDGSVQESSADRQWTKDGNDMYSAVSGDVGIGTNAPDERLHVRGNIMADWEHDPKLTIRNHGKDHAAIGVFPGWHSNDVFIAGYNKHTHAGSTWATERVHIGKPEVLTVCFTNNSYVGSFTDGSVGIGTVSPQSLLDVRGTIRTEILTITGGADLAEPFEVSGSETIPAGALVVIDAACPGKIKMSTKPYDGCVAGVVSGAGGLSPGLTLSQAGVVEEGMNVALSGRVYAMATAANGSISPGDLLTTSHIPGTAMRATNSERAFGTVIGKAMSALDEGDGLVLVLVSLQ